MTIEIDFLTFATGAGANVEPQETYAADPVQQSGYQPGIAPSAQVSKVNRQGNFFSAVLAQFIGTVQQANVLDDGSLTGKIAQLWQSLLAGGYFVDGGTANALLVANPTTPAGALTFIAPQAGTRCSINILHNNTGASTIDWMGVNTSPVVTAAGAALTGGELIANRIVDFEYDGTYWQIVSQQGNVVPVTALQAQVAVTSGTELTLGNGYVWVNGINYESSNSTITNSGLSASTAYYLYLYLNAGVQTLELSATSYTLAANGVPQKTGDATRTLIAIVGTNASSQFADSGASRLVANWTPTPGGKTGEGRFTATRTVTGSAFTEINAELRVNFITIAGRNVVFYVNGEVGTSNTSIDGIHTALTIDGSVQNEQCASQCPNNVNGASMTIVACKTLSEGLHYASLDGGSISGDTGSWYSNYPATSATEPNGTVLQVTISG